MKPTFRIKAIHLWKDLDTYYGIHDQLLCLGQYIDRESCDYSVCFFHAKQGDLRKRFETLDIPIHDLGVSSHRDLGIVPRLIGLFKREKPDIVQTYCLNTNIIGTLCARLAGVPIVIQTELTGKDQAPTAMKRLRDGAMYPLYTLVRSWADTAVFISDAVKKEWAGPRPPARFRTIYPAFNIEKFNRFRSLIEAKKPGLWPGPQPTIGIVARLSEEKRHCDLLQAFLQVLQSHPHARLLVVGTGPLDGVLRSLTMSLKISGSVEFTGHSENVFQELAKMDLFVLPSRSEGAGIAIMEAMAAGLPVVASNVGGIPEIVQDGQTGILVPPYNPAKIAEAILHLFHSPEKAHEMGRKGKERAFTAFHPGQFASQHVELYRELFTAKQRPSS